jgi:uncharacterized protein DUF6572
MSVDQPDKVDIISTTPEGKVMLTIADHLPWDEQNEHLLLLQNKINSYLTFIETGQIFEEYPNAQNSILVIQISMKYEPVHTALHFLNLCKETILKSDIEFSWEIIR